VRLLSLSTVLSAVLVAGVVPRAARAAPPDGPTDPARAKELFEHGRDLRGRGDCADALPLFQKAYALYPAGLGSLRNAAACQEALGRTASARAAWLELRRALGTNSDPKYAGWAEDADRASTRLAPLVAALTIDLSLVETVGGPGRAVGPADGVDVTIDGQALAREQLGAPIEHDPGTVVVRAVGAAGATPDEASVALAPGESKHVTLRITVASATPAPAVEAPASASESDGSATAASPLRRDAWIALGVGAAGLAGALVSFSFRQSALGDLAVNCPTYASGTCDASKETLVSSDLNRGRTASTMLNVFGAVGIAGAVAGVALFTLSVPSRKTAVLLLPNGVSAAGTF
jgi:hypothetical protein